MSIDQPTPDHLKRTPLYEQHVALGARVVPFAGWEMPVQYSGVVDEVRAVRQAAGLFDVSHMGELHVTGPGGLAWLNSMTTNDVGRLDVGRAHYSLLCRHDGGILDDILVYRLDEDDFMVVVNASNTEKDANWLQQHVVPGVELEDSSTATALLALQGPAAERVLQPLAETPLSELRRFRCVPARVAGIDCLVSRTGYTGEDGFELFTQGDVLALWDALLEAGAGQVKPCGLGARDVCRIEAGNVLYRHEIGEGINPVAADLMWTVKLEKGAFMGSETLKRLQAEGVPLKLVGFEMLSRAIPRQDYPLAKSGEPVGFVTSGTFSPTLGKPIGIGYLPPDAAQPGTAVEVLVRGRPEPAQIVSLPFYRGPNR
jgi:aminomethyltransferase